MSEERAAEIAERWQANRAVVRCSDPDGWSEHYVGGFRIRRLPTADQQARKMR